VGRSEFPGGDLAGEYQLIGVLQSAAKGRINSLWRRMQRNELSSCRPRFAGMPTCIVSSSPHSRTEITVYCNTHHKRGMGVVDLFS